MAADVALSKPPTVTHIAARIAFGLFVMFPVLVIVLHVLEPEFDPSWRLLSEYELGRYSWMMQLAFLSLAVGSVALTRAIEPFTRTLIGFIGQILLLVISMAFAGATVFSTDPVTASQISTAGMIHTAAGVVVVLGFPIMATLIGWSLSRNNTWTSTGLWLFLATLLVWLGWLSFRSILAANQGALGPRTAAGWPNRFMMATYTLWLLVVAWLAQRRAQTT